MTKPVVITGKCISKEIGRYNTAKRDEAGEIIYNKDGEPREIIVGEFVQVHLNFVDSKGDCWDRNPHGTFPLVCLKPEYGEMFEVGKEYKVTVEPVTG